MANKANVVFVLGYAQNENKLAKNKVYWDKYSEKRAFYSCNKTDIDHLAYIDKGSKEQMDENVMDYVCYSGNDEKSQGVFNENGLMSRKEKAELRKSLRNTQSVIWHGIISFEDAFGKRHMADWKDAHRLMSLELPKFLKSAGFDPDKIEWFAGLHENTDNMHIHLSFFEKEPSRYSERGSGVVFSHGKISSCHFDRFKVRIEQRLTDITSEIKAARKELTDLTRNLLFSTESNIRYRSDIQNSLKNLLDALPAEGRLGYDSANMRALKPQVKRVIDSLFKINQPLYKGFLNYCNQIKKNDLNTLNILKSNKIPESEWGKYLIADKYLDDVYRRLGNQVINSVRFIKSKEKKVKNSLANKQIRRRTVRELLAYSLQLNSYFETEAARTFEEFLRKLEEEKYKNEDIQNEMA